MPETDLIQIANEIYTYSALLLKFFNQSLEERLQSSDVTISSLQYNILRMLQSETLTISTISQRMGMDPASLVRIMDTLERKGLALRSVDPHDRRRNPIQITKKGFEFLAASQVISEKDLTFQALQSLGLETSAQLRDLLLKVIQQFPEGRLVTGLMSGQPGTEIESNDAKAS